tara:strand:- start:2586 stop:3683 length:1098 start_codon:yes stop_codon:yes gene_type:complete
MRFFLIFIISFFILEITAQNCYSPNILSVNDSLTTQYYNFKELQFNSIDSAQEYRIRFKKISDPIWEYRYMYLDTAKFFGFEHNETYIWNVKTFCDTILNINSSWSIQDTFITNSFVPINFSPFFNIQLSHYICDSISDLNFLIEQDPNEPDISSSSVFSSSGSFTINLLNVGDIVGEASVVAGGGFYNFEYTLVVDQIISNNAAVIAMNNDSTGVIDGSFIIENDIDGIKIVNTVPSDGNFYTTGNSSDVTFYNLFLNPPPGNLNFFTSIQSELGDNDNQNIDFTISCLNNFQNILIKDSEFKIIDDQLVFYNHGDLMIYNLSGQLIYKKVDSEIFNISFLDNSLYFFTFQSENKIIKDKLIIY